MKVLKQLYSTAAEDEAAAEEGKGTTFELESISIFEYLNQFYTNKIPPCILHTVSEGASWKRATAKVIRKRLSVFALVYIFGNYLILSTMYKFAFVLTQWEMSFPAPDSNPWLWMMGDAMFFLLNVGKFKSGFTCLLEVNES